MSIAESPAATSAALDGQNGILDLYAEIRGAHARFAGMDGKTRQLPPNLHSFLGQVLGELKAGKSVTILESDASMTTAAAARTLSVSRQFLVQLLEQGQIPFHKVGTHRRVYTRDLLAYKAKRDAERREAWSDLVRAEIEDGTYFAVPMNALVKQ
jgi:excisionase family DNA binding protein